DEFSERDQRTKIRPLHRLDRAGVPDHARQPAGWQRPRRQDSRRAAGRLANRRAAVRGAAYSVAGQARSAGASDRMAAACLIRWAIGSLLKGRNTRLDDDVAPFGRLGGDELGEFLGSGGNAFRALLDDLGGPDGSLTAATSSSLSLAVIGVGVPWGANNPSHP